MLGQRLPHRTVFGRQSLFETTTINTPKAVPWYPGALDRTWCLKAKERSVADQPEFFEEIDPAPIPEILHSAYEEGPFTGCTTCNEGVLDGRVYEIQKVYRGPEVILEMAVCHTCGTNIAREFSEESVGNFQDFFTGNFRSTSQAMHCNFCGLPRGILPNFTIVGVCRESALLAPSFVMCEKCTDRLQELISRKTRDVQGDFIRDNFPGIPADFDLSPTLGGILG